MNIVPISIDAFHFNNEYLSGSAKDGKTLKDVKGRYDKYDVPALISCLEEFRRGGEVHFPEYSRKTHDPVENAIIVGERPAILVHLCSRVCGCSLIKLIGAR